VSDLDSNLLPPGVADAFDLGAPPRPATPPQTPAVAVGAPAPVPAPKKPKRPRRRPRKPSPARSEELDVAARETGPHRDLRGVVGFLTVDYDADDRPYEATFDPFDERLQNAVIPVHGWLQSDGRIHLTDEDAVRWRFDLLDTPEEYEDEDYEEEDDHD
jgi:hypothetical protein